MTRPILTQQPWLLEVHQRLPKDGKRYEQGNLMMLILPQEAS
ncbi:hypothetical protein [Pseudomonas farris]|nr:hypothetical protein [Pseudomonas farris]